MFSKHRNSVYQSQQYTHYTTEQKLTFTFRIHGQKYFLEQAFILDYFPFWGIFWISG